MENCENCKVKMEIVDNEGKVIGAMTIECDTIKVGELHGISMLDEVYNQLLLEINKT